MSLKKIILLILLLLLSILPLTACMDSQELNKMAVTGLVIMEKKMDDVLLFMEVYNTETENIQSSEPVKYIESCGESAFDAIRNTTTSFDKKIFFAHAKELIVNEKIAENELLSILDMWQRQHGFWPNTYLIISKNTDPAEILGTQVGIETSTADYIYDLMNNDTHTSKSVKITIRDFLKNYYDNGVAVAGVVSKDRYTYGKKKLNVEGSAIFSNDQFLGFLSGIETKSMNFALGNVKSAVVVSPGIDGIGTNSVEVLDMKRDVEVITDKEDITFKLNLEISGLLVEETGNPDTNENYSILSKIGEQNSIVIEKNINNLINKCQNQLEVDIFGFGDALHKQNPELWKKVKDNWNEEFTNTKIVVNVKTNIDSVGLIHTPIDRKFDEQ